MGMDQSLFLNSYHICWLFLDHTNQTCWDLRNRVAEAPLAFGILCARAARRGTEAAGGHQNPAPRGVHAQDPKVQDLTQVNVFTWAWAWIGCLMESW